MTFADIYDKSDTFSFSIVNFSHMHGGQHTLKTSIQSGNFKVS